MKRQAVPNKQLSVSECWKRSRDSVDIGTIMEKTHKHARKTRNYCNCFSTITLTFSDRRGRESNVSIDVNTISTASASSGGDGLDNERNGNKDKL